MKVLFVSSEMYPLVKIGGLGDVAGSLPLALGKMGIDIRVVIPRYCFINIDLDLVAERSFNFGNVKIYRYNVGDLPVYLVEIGDVFCGDVYRKDDWKRWILFSRVVAHLPDIVDFHPDIVHINDWMTSPLAAYTRNCSHEWKIVLTIHNLKHQGIFPIRIIRSLGLRDDFLPVLTYNGKINFLKSAIELADVVTTVSPTYAKEILTPEYGEGLDSELKKYKHKIRGILNGLDYSVWNPETDSMIFKNYSVKDADLKKENKKMLCKEIGCDSTKPLFGFVARLVEQKGVDILISSISSINNAEFVVLGTGREKYEKALQELGKKKDNVHPVLRYDEGMAHQIYASSDFFLMPSRFEPCGLGQIIAMRYGTIPVVRETGGLKDTVKDISQNGWGFTFSEYSAPSLTKAIKRAIDYYQSVDMEDLSRKVMGLDFSWKKSAEKYAKLYSELLRTF